MTFDLGDILRLFVWLIAGVFLLSLVLALWLPKSTKGRTVSVLSVLLVFGGSLWVLFGATPARKAQIQVQQQATTEYQQRLAKAKALFEERCKAAGEKIYRKVTGVDGLLLLRLRPTTPNLNDQYALNDPYGSDFLGESYITSFLWGRNPNGNFSQAHTRNTYQFVEVPEVGSELVTRYRAILASTPAGDPIFQYDIKKNQQQLAKYGVDWDDISTKEDRDNWIAGSSLKVVDLKSRAVVAERTGFMFDHGLGSTAGGRAPWAFAEFNACPAFGKSASGNPSKTVNSRGFILRAIEPKLED